MKIVVFLRAVNSEILHEIAPFALFLVKKQEKNTLYLSKKPLRFVKIVVFLRAVTSEILHEISPFALFLVKKQEKNTLYQGSIKVEKPRNLVSCKNV